MYLGSGENKQKVLDAICDEMLSPKSVGNLCLSLWISTYPKTKSNARKPEQSVPKLSQAQGDAVPLFSVDTSATQTHLCA